MNNGSEALAFIFGVIFMFIMAMIFVNDMITIKRVNEQCMTYHKTQTVEQAQTICKAIVRGDK